MSPDSQFEPEIIYVGDPMCSWCWGMAPVVEYLARRPDVDMRIVVGGLRPGSAAQPLDDELRRVLTHHWESVAERTGQPFDPAGLRREGWLYDTEIPARAVVTMRRLAPEHELGMFTRIQQAFYAEGGDVTDPAAYPALVKELDVDESAFMDMLLSDESRTAAWDDFAAARELGVAGFPTVLLRIDGKLQVLSRGYAGIDYFESALAHWLEGVQAASTNGACSLDVPC
jgi:putative protein-disulfide isomerase